MMISNNFSKDDYNNLETAYTKTNYQFTEERTPRIIQGIEKLFLAIKDTALNESGHTEQELSSLQGRITNFVLRENDYKELEEHSSDSFDSLIDNHEEQIQKLALAHQKPNLNQSKQPIENLYQKILKTCAFTKNDYDKLKEDLNKPVNLNAEQTTHNLIKKFNFSKECPSFNTSNCSQEDLKGLSADIEVHILLVIEKKEEAFLKPLEEHLQEKKFLTRSFLQKHTNQIEYLSNKSETELTPKGKQLKKLLLSKIIEGLSWRPFFKILSAIYDFLMSALERKIGGLSSPFQLLKQYSQADLNNLVTSLQEEYAAIQDKERALLNEEFREKTSLCIQLLTALVKKWSFQGNKDLTDQIKETLDLISTIQR